MRRGGEEPTVAPVTSRASAGRRNSCRRAAPSGQIVRISAMEIVLRTRTPDGIEVILSALVYAKILEEHAAVADLDLIDRTVREPDERRPDPRPGRERFLRHEAELWALAVVDFDGVPAIIVTVFSAEVPPA